MKNDEPQQGLIAREYKRLKDRCVWSWAGFRHTYVSEPSFRSWVYANVLSIGLTFALPITPAQQLIIVVLGILVLVAELLNTSIERLTDLVTQEHHELAGQAKDAGSAAVAVTAIAAGVAWGFALVGLMG